MKNTKKKEKLDYRKNIVQSMENYQQSLLAKGITNEKAKLALFPKLTDTDEEFSTPDKQTKQPIADKRIVPVQKGE